MEKQNAPEIFDKRRIRARRERSAKKLHDHDFLHQRAWADIVDRLETVNRSFGRAVILGANPNSCHFSQQCKVDESFWCDSARGRLAQGDFPLFIADEDKLPLGEGRIDLAISFLTLHFSNDPVGAMLQWRRALKPDGLFIAALFGEQTLQHFRSALYQAESALLGGVHPRITPFATVQDLGGALQRAGFALPVVDIDKATVQYANPISLLHDLRGMGETNGLRAASAPLTRKVLFRALEIFKERGGEEQFDIVYLTGWAPAANQPKPLRPGSGKVSMEDAIMGKPIRSPS